MALVVFAPDDEPNVFALFQWIRPFKYEALILCFNEGEASGNAGEHSAHTTSDDLFESFEKREILLVEPCVFRDGEDNTRGVSFLQFSCDVVDEKFIAGNGDPVLGIEITEVREL